MTLSICVYDCEGEFLTYVEVEQEDVQFPLVLAHGERVFLVDGTTVTDEGRLLGHEQMPIDINLTM